jgi:glucokinase
MTSLLAGDIGGTKTLLALYGVEHGELRQRRCERFVSAEWDDFSALVKHFLASGPSDEPHPVSACFAVAGPVRGGRVQLTNLPWLLEEGPLAAACGLGAVELVNDFAVLIYGLPHLEAQQQVPLQGPVAGDPQAPVAILGAGTGLGVAMGVPTPSGLVAVASEASHGEFAPRTEAEWQLKRWLMADLDLERLSIERVVSGTGLGDVMRWHLAMDPDGADHALASRADGDDLPAATAAAAAAGDPLARCALDLWLGAYGSVAGDLALQSLCLGGLWIGGGTAGKLLTELRSSAFLNPFLAKGRLSPVVEQVPLTALTDPEAGLFSAACRARMLLG